MSINRKIVLKFNTDFNQEASITIPDSKPTVSDAEVNNCMDILVQNSVFDLAVGYLTAKNSAQQVVVTKSTVAV